MDKIFKDFLVTQEREGYQLALNSDVLDLQALSRPAHSQFYQSSASPIPTHHRDDPSDDEMRVIPSSHYLARYRCNSYLMSPGAEFSEISEPKISENVLFTIGIHFHADYLRAANFYKVISLLSPPNLWHPNAKFPYLCVGRLEPGTPLVDILYQVFDLITFRNTTVREDNSLNPAACQWFRGNWDGRPVDNRPLRRRKLNFTLSSTEE